MPVGDCMRSHTHRQYLSWMHWLNEEWDNPSRTDLYLMQVACEVRRVLARHPNKVTMSDFKLKFVVPGNAPASKSGEEQADAAELATRRSQAKWFGALGLPLPADDGPGG
jgi:hypothetical protein